MKEIIGTKSSSSSYGKTYIYDESEAIAIVPKNVLITIEIFIPKSDSEKSLYTLKTYSSQ